MKKTENTRMKKNRGPRRTDGLMLELVKVLFIFSVADEALLCVAAAWTGDLSLMPWMTALLLIPVYSVLALRFVRNFFGFLFLHLLLFAVPLLYPDVVSRILAALFVIADILYIYVRRLTGSNEPMSFSMTMVAFGLAAVLYFAAPALKIEFVRPTLSVLFLLQLTAYLVYFHQNNVRETLAIQEEDRNQSLGKIHSFNNRILLAFVLVMLLLVGAGLIFRLDVVLAEIGHLLFTGFKALIRLLFRGGSEDEESGEVPKETVPDGGGGPLLPADDTEPFLIWKILEAAAVVVTAVLILAGICYILYKFYKKFTEGRVEESQQADYRETTVFLERVKREKKERRPFREYFILSNEQKVRRLYKKRIEKQIRAGVKVEPSRTVQEIRALLPQEDLAKISEVYEKARYSGQPVSREELRSAET